MSESLEEWKENAAKTLSPSRQDFEDLITKPLSTLQKAVAAPLEVTADFFRLGAKTCSDYAQSGGLLRAAAGTTGQIALGVAANVVETAKELVDDTPRGHIETGQKGMASAWSIVSRNNVHHADPLLQSNAKKEVELDTLPTPKPPGATTTPSGSQQQPEDQVAMSALGAPAPGGRNHP